MVNLLVAALAAFGVSGCIELPDFGAESAAREVAQAYISDVTGTDPVAIKQSVRIAGSKAYVSAEHGDGFKRCELVLRRTIQDNKTGWRVEHATCGYAT